MAILGLDKGEEFSNEGDCPHNSSPYARPDRFRDLAFAKTDFGNSGRT
jgi:hypothetical protein